MWVLTILLSLYIFATGTVFADDANPGSYHAACHARLRRLGEASAATFVFSAVPKFGSIKFTAFARVFSVKCA
jgi:hypothetical protein